jgi:RNA polymerase sigma-70 factor (ECF subfamily)
MKAAPIDLTVAAAAPALSHSPERRRPTRAERKLAAGLRRGDERAVKAVHDEYGATTFGYLLRMLGDRAAAEDVQQQVFIEVWQRGKGFDPKRGTLLAWILTIARSRAVDYMRRRIPEPRDPETTRDQVAEDAHDDALLEQWRIAHYLRRLHPEESAMLRMRFYHGLSQTEISDRTGVPLGTVKMRMVQALDRLRGMIEAEEGVRA